MCSVFIGAGPHQNAMEDNNDGEAPEIDEFAMFQARSLGAESEYLLLKQASRHRDGVATQRSSPRTGAVYTWCANKTAPL